MASLTRETLPNFFGSLAASTFWAAMGLIYSTTPAVPEKECRAGLPPVLMIMIGQNFEPRAGNKIKIPRKARRAPRIS